ncbi:MAG: hypothetical protein ACP5XB_32000, partial [Isosphaeraceae bacterium]
MKTADWGRHPDVVERRLAWFRRNGIDAHCLSFVRDVDLQLWLVDNSRWGTLESEIRKDEPLRLGQEASETLLRFDETAFDF